jgi:hypothetical protein
LAVLRVLRAAFASRSLRFLHFLTAFNRKGRRDTALLRSSAKGAKKETDPLPGGGFILFFISFYLPSLFKDINDQKNIS